MRAKIALYKNPDFSPEKESAGQQAAMSDDDDEEGDFPEVLLEELVDEMQDMQLEEDEDAEDGSDEPDGHADANMDGA